MQIPMGYKIVDDKMVMMTLEEKAAKGLIREEDIPQLQIEDEIVSLKQYLQSTDWYGIRLAETGKAIPDAVLQERAQSRERISQLEGGV